MRLRSRATAAFAAVIALGLTAVLSASTTVAASPKGTLTAPCGKATVAKLNTGFMCDVVYVPKSKSAETVAKIEASPSMEVALAAGGGAGTCSFTGCYDYFNGLHTGYDAVGSYGWRYSDGSYQRIGTITIDIDDYITGATTTKIAPFCFSSTHSTWGTYHVVERYYATGANGSNGPLPVRKGIESVGKSLTATNAYKYCLPATGNKDFNGNAAANFISDAQTARGTIYHYVTWRTAGFSGKWYLYSKSIIFSRPTGTSYLNFYGDMRLPYASNGASWLPN